MILSALAALSLLRTLENMDHVAEKVLSAGPVGDEIPAVAELQKRVNNIMWNEYSKGHSTMLRWLRFNKMNIDKAEAGLREHAKWRKEIDMDRLRVEPPNPEMLKRFFFNVTGYARNGDPVMVIPYGDWDVRGYAEKVGNKRAFDQHQGSMWEKGLYAAELVEMNLKKPRKDPTRYMIICDLGTLKYSQLASYLTLQYVFSMVYNFENNYLNFMKPLMRGSVEKMKILPKDRTKWERYVRRYVDPITLPYRYGGYSKTERKKLKLPPRHDD